ncbi:MAG: transcription termination/antitermination protein NusA [Acidobacteria bacterium]|nr:MAG: transcription termination/antitermination protein NusA [Acidobacteriota bacterium]
MTTSLLYQAIDQLSREKGIDLEIVISAVEDAYLVATRKYYKTNEDLQSHFNKETGVVEVFAVKKVVEQVADPDREMTLDQARKLQPEAALESEIRIPKATDMLGRIAAQTAKQVIFQKVREAERDTVYAEYSNRVGELVNCTVKRLEGPEVIVDLGRAEARMPRREQLRLETYQIGDRLRAVIKEVDRAARGPQVVVSRADGMLVQRLFEMEVPEIYDGTVVIKTIAREAGERSKVAVFSKDADVDCVGACVGMKGMRVQSIIRELRGEKIDIIEYNEDAIAFAANALSPAKINHVSVVDAEEKHLEVIVDDTQLSLAIGKKGQNVRLAAKLLGWHIDIKSEEEKRQEIESQMAAMARRGAAITELLGLGDKTLEKLRNHGIATVEQLAQMTPDELTQIQGIGEKTVERIRVVVTDYFERGEATAAEAGEPATETGDAADSGSPAEVEEAGKEALTEEAVPAAASPSSSDADVAGSEAVDEGDRNRKTSDEDLNPQAIEEAQGPEEARGKGASDEPAAESVEAASLHERREAGPSPEGDEHK